MRTLSPPWRKVLIGSWVMIAVLSVVTLILYVDNKRTKECLGDYIAKDNASTAQRVKLTDKEREAFKITLRTIVSEPDVLKRQKAINDYITLLDEDDKIRQQNPVEPVPTECN